MHFPYGPNQTLMSLIVPNGSLSRKSFAHLRQVIISFVSSAPAGATGSAEPAGRTVPPPAGSGRVYAAGPRRRGSRTRNHPDPAEPGHAAEQVGQPQHQDGRPQGESEDSAVSIWTVVCFWMVLTLSFEKPSRGSWRKPFPWQQVFRRPSRTP